MYKDQKFSTSPNYFDIHFHLLYIIFRIIKIPKRGKYFSQNY